MEEQDGHLILESLVEGKYAVTFEDEKYLVIRRQWGKTLGKPKRLTAADIGMVCAVLRDANPDVFDEEALRATITALLPGGSDQRE
jgi:hypothetical protein